MRRLVLICPGLLGEPGGDSVLRKSPRQLEPFLERGAISRLHPEPPSITPEAAWLGLDPARFRVEQGPLTVAALGADPPERSVHFHLSLAGVDPEGRIRLGAEPTEEEVREVMRRARALQTPSLAIVEGSGLDHGLVWEDGSLDLGVTPLDQAVGHFVHDRLPQGDGELLLRRFVDDSVNLLTNVELNRRRADEGRPTLELLWPWGPGFRPAMPNLALLRGEPIWLASNSLRTRGLGRLSGLRLLEMHAKFEDVWECLAEDRTLIWEFEQAREWREKDLDRLDHWFRAFCQTILGALWEAREEHPVRLAILAPGLAEGLALDASTNDPAREGVRVFDERRLGDPALPLSYSWELILQITKA